MTTLEHSPRGSIWMTEMGSHWWRSWYLSRCSMLMVGSWEFTWEAEMGELDYVCILFYSYVLTNRSTWIGILFIYQLLCQIQLPWLICPQALFKLFSPLRVAAVSPEMDLAQLSLYHLSVPYLIYLASRVILLQFLINHPSHSWYHTQTVDDTVIQNQD